jgi:hypothetical protein
MSQWSSTLGYSLVEVADSDNVLQATCFLYLCVIDSPRKASAFYFVDLLYLLFDELVVL